jgi:hypothetical protein
MNRCHACAVAGLAACAHLAVLGVTEVVQVCFEWDTKRGE